MKIAFLNLCHCEPEIVARVANKLTRNPEFDMYIHVDAKQEEMPFSKRLEENGQVHFIKNRQKVYWGGFNAIRATIALLEAALESNQHYERFVLLQNLDYPVRSNEFIEEFFVKNKEIEYIRGCKIAHTKDWHYAKKYKIYNHRDSNFYLKRHRKVVKKIHDGWNAIRSIPTIGFSGTIKEQDGKYDIYYGAAQWAVTRACAEYFVYFFKTHPRYNKRMQHIQFPDEEYFHTIVHNSGFKYRCRVFDEPEQRWLVNWRNLHYFEFPKEITVLTEKDFDKIMSQEVLFCRKVKSKESKQLMDQIDRVT